MLDWVTKWGVTFSHRVSCFPSLRKKYHLKIVFCVYSGCLFKALQMSSVIFFLRFFNIVFVSAITATSKAGVIAGAVMGALLLLFLLLLLVWLFGCCYKKQRYEKETAHEIKWGIIFLHMTHSIQFFSVSFSINYYES